MKPRIFSLLIALIFLCAACVSMGGTPAASPTQNTTPETDDAGSVMKTDEIIGEPALLPEEQVNIDKLTLDGAGQEDDMLEITILRSQAEDLSYRTRVLLEITLGDGAKLQHSYERLDLATVKVHHEAFFTDGTAAVMVVDTNAASNYNASDVHIFRVQDSDFTEVLLVLDTPDSLRDLVMTAEMQNAVFAIPQPSDNFGIDDSGNYSIFCVDGEFMEFGGGAAVLIQHGVNQYTPYSILLYQNDAWSVAEQKDE